MDNLTFIKIDKPTELRRDVLRCALDSTALIKRFSEIKDIKQKKINHINDLKQEFDKINRIISGLDKNLPREEERKIEIHKPKKVEPNVIDGKRDIEADLLTQEMKDIENKLRNL